jgi:hypothetical protein
MLDARDSLGGLPDLIDCILAGDRPRQRDHTVRRRNVNLAIRHSGCDLGFHGGRNLTVGSGRFNARRTRTSADRRRFLPCLRWGLLRIGDRAAWG